MSTLAIIICVFVVAAILVFVVFNVSFAINKRMDEMHKSIAAIREANKQINSDFTKRICKLEYESFNRDKSDSEFTTAIDKRDKRLHDFAKQFPMFKENTLCVNDRDDYLYIMCDDGSILKYRSNDKAITVYKMSTFLKTLHASTTGEKRHMQLFDTLELLCNDKIFRSVYPVNDEDNNTLDVVMKDMNVLRYNFNRSCKGDGMIIEFLKYRGVLESSKAPWE